MDYQQTVWLRHGNDLQLNTSVVFSYPDVLFVRISVRRHSQGVYVFHHIERMPLADPMSACGTAEAYLHSYLCLTQILSSSRVAVEAQKKRPPILGGLFLSLAKVR